MNILAISSSVIVLELLSMVLKSENIDAEFVKSTKDANDDSYNIIFIDDSTFNINLEVDDIIDNFSYNKLILIGKNKKIEDIVDIVIRKPFLPNDIKDLIESVDIEPLELENKDFKTNVLDPNEVAKIKALMNLDDEDDEKISSYESVFFELLEDKESLNLKKKGAKEFLYECTNMDEKELKKLLKGAKVSIKIKFKSDKNE